MERWLRATWLQVFRWLLVLLGTPFALRVSGTRARQGVLLIAIAVHFVMLYTIVTQKSWYQVAYVALPLALLGGCSLDALRGVVESRKRGWLSSSARVILIGAVIEGLLWLSVYPVVSVVQWRERSYASVRQGLARVLPRDAKVATDFGAYFPTLEIGLRPVLLDLRRPVGEKRQERRQYQRKLADAGFEFFVLQRGRSTHTLAPELERSLVFVSTVGRPKAPLPFVRDAAYHFDVYRAARLSPGRRD
jgi:hypothetical protein